MDLTKWSYRKKVVIGLISAYLSAVILQISFHAVILFTSARSFSECMSDLFDFAVFDLYFGTRWFLLFYESADASTLMTASIPIILFLLLPNLFTWLFLSICINIAFFIPVIINIT